MSDLITDNLDSGLAAGLWHALSTESSLHGHFWDNFTAGQQQVKQGANAYAQQHPGEWTTAIATAAGAVPNTLAAMATLGGSVPESAASVAVPLWKQMLLGSAISGTAQGVQTAANAKGNPIDRAKAVLSTPVTQSLPAMAMGAALPVAGRLASNMTDLLTGNRGATAGTNTFLDRLGQNDMTPQDLGTALKTAPPDAPVVAADFMGRPGRRLVRWTTDQPTAGGNVLTNQLQSRTAGQMDRTLSNMSDAMGQDFQNIPATKVQMNADMKARAAPAYAAALPQPLPQAVADNIMTLRGKFPEIEKAFGGGSVLRAGDQAIADLTAPATPGAEGAVDRLSPAITNDPKMMAFLQEKNLLPPGGAETAPAMTVGDVHYAKLALDDQINSRAEGSGVGPTRARQLRIALNSILDQTEAAVPEYAAARQQYRGDSEIDDALDLGTTALHTPVNELQQATKDFTPGEMNAFRMSAMDQLKQAASKVDTRKDLMTRWLASPDMEARLQLIAPTDEAGQSILAHRDLERQMSLTNAAPTAGSNTSTNLADQPGGNGQLLGAAAVAPISARRAIMRVAGMGAQMAHRSMSGALSEQLAPMLGTDASGADDLIERLLSGWNKSAGQALAQRGAAVAAGRWGANR